MSIRTDGKIRVTIPMYSTFESGKEFVVQNLEWINETKEKIRKNGRAPRMFQPGSLFSTRNYQYLIIRAEVSRMKIRVAEENRTIYFEVPLNQNMEDDQVQKALKGMIENVLRFEAKHYLPERIKKLALSLGYTFNKVTIKNNRTNWGSCSNEKNINLNLHLMRLNDELIDYVLVHELVHTAIPNHGTIFHATLLGHLKNKIKLEHELKQLGTTIL